MVCRIIRDLDSDNDGLNDVIEAGSGSTWMADGQADAGSGPVDTALTVPDTDADGTARLPGPRFRTTTVRSISRARPMRRLDVDGDGTIDATEDGDGDGLPDGR